MAVENPFDQKIGYQFSLDLDDYTIKPLGKNVIVRDMNFEGRTLDSGIVLLGDDGKTDGIRPRWAQVYTVGPDQTDVAVGQWVLLEHGRWSRGIKIIKGGEEFTNDRLKMAANKDDGYTDGVSSVEAQKVLDAQDDAIFNKTKAVAIVLSCFAALSL